jgi:hypothetical protein
VDGDWREVEGFGRGAGEFGAAFGGGAVGRGVGGDGGREVAELD